MLNEVGLDWGYKRKEFVGVVNTSLGVLLLPFLTLKRVVSVLFYLRCESSLERYISFSRRGLEALF
jgi:hypothetical protein